LENSGGEGPRHFHVGHFHCRGTVKGVLVSMAGGCCSKWNECDFYISSPPLHLAQLSGGPPDDKKQGTTDSGGAAQNCLMTSLLLYWLLSFWLMTSCKDVRARLR
jgi:hypothetical protein